MTALTRVLVVDDNELNLELARFALADAGFEVASALDAAQAHLRIADFAPQLILMDIQMPGVDGLTLTLRLKSDAATAHIVVVAFTACAMKGDEAKMRAAGCDGYISKPIDVRTFAQRVRACLPAGPPGGAPD
jgi:two-component system cell cycle response regulator DivK